jgi:uroporphyrinogen decarboxylase
MNTRERFLAVMDFEPCDRTLLWEWGYWGGAVERWYKEGLPRIEGLPKPVEFGETLAGPGAAWRSGVLNVPDARDVADAVALDDGRETIPLQNFVWPPFQEEVLDEDDETVTVRSKDGVTLKQRKDAGSVPHPLAWPVSDRYDWERLKSERFQPKLEDRLPANWDALVLEYKHRDYPLSIASGYCGFFGALRALMGEVNLFYAYYDNPSLLHDMADFLCNFWIEIYGRVLQQVHDVESAEFWEDMCYKNGPMISPAMFREFMMPYYKRLIGALRDQGVRHFCVDTDGDCRSLIPLFLECGMTGMLPFEVQAGCDIVEIRKKYPHLQIYAGLDKNLVAQGKQAIDAELEAKLPPLLRQGGYIPFVDHLVHPDISWENFAYYRQRVSELAVEHGSAS